MLKSLEKKCSTGFERWLLHRQITQTGQGDHLAYYEILEDLCQCCKSMRAPHSDRVMIPVPEHTKARMWKREIPKRPISKGVLPEGSMNPQARNKIAMHMRYLSPTEQIALICARRFHREHRGRASDDNLLNIDLGNGRTHELVLVIIVVGTNADAIHTLA